jgi:hypothetical protein
MAQTPLNSWEGGSVLYHNRCKKKKKRRSKARETDRRCEMNMEYMYYVFRKHNSITEQFCQCN